MKWSHRLRRRRGRTLFPRPTAARAWFRSGKKMRKTMRKTSAAALRRSLLGTAPWPTALVMISRSRASGKRLHLLVFSWHWHCNNQPEPRTKGHAVLRQHNMSWSSLATLALRREELSTAQFIFEPSASGEPGNKSKRQRQCQCQRRLSISGLAKRRRCSDYYCERMNRTCAHSLEFNLGTFSPVFTASPQKTLGFNLLNLLLCRTFRFFGMSNREKVAPDGGEPGRGIAGPLWHHDRLISRTVHYGEQKKWKRWAFWHFS